MEVIEESPDHLRLSNAGSFLEKWGCVAIILVVILAVTFFCAKTVRPTPYIGVASGIFLLFVLTRELFRGYNKEFWFDRSDNLLKVIKRPLLGGSQQTVYPLSSITSIRKIERRARGNRSWYPGYEDDIDAYDPIKGAIYDVKISFQSGETLVVSSGEKNKKATQLVKMISEFLGLTLNSVSRNYK